MPTPIDILPQELFDIIFENLVALDKEEGLRKRSILASSLVSRLWAQRTFEHRFRSLVLYVLCEDAPSVEEVHNVNTLVGLEWFSQAVASVRGLELRFGTRERPFNIATDLHLLINRFPRLQSLHLVGLIGMCSSPASRVPTISHIQRLKINLSPGGISPVFSSDLGNVLSQFSTIGELHVVDLWGWSREPSGPRSDIGDLPLLRIASLVVEQSRLLLLDNVMCRVVAEGIRTLDLISVRIGLHDALELPESLPVPPEHLFI
ncbi:hypothetical protein PsYK624_060010 [Phanerochaete sordida]|uniref:F-box domain-containing protein n=1 Tax=Phanerochaete sordida TaxID=48140 RepID=A0A9P3LCS8_9APHY|nr:hypothetical protein PsYK624_060010 [Phanerochaete sordida]